MRACFAYFSSHPWGIAAFLLLAGGVPFAGSMLAEYGFGMKPCHLCLVQRYLYLAVLGVGAVAAALLCRPLLQKYILILGTLLLMGNAGTATYHTLVEHKLIAAPGCASEIPANASIDELRAQILAAPLTRCDEPTLIFGVSMAVWNILLAGGLSVSAIILYRRHTGGTQP